MAAKIVVIGDINGNITEVLTKVAGLHAKNNFAFAIVAGNLFADPSKASEKDKLEEAKLLQGEIKVPLTTYFALSSHALPSNVAERLKANSGEACPNLFVLGRKVSFKTSEGLKVVAIGGSHADAIEDESMDQYSSVYKDADVKSAMEFKDADILITSDWPSGIAEGSQVIKSFTGDVPTGNSILGELCSILKPRYHFSTSTVFFEREPFFHDGPAPRFVTRFLSLAPYGNPNKQKWIYAFSLAPSAPPPDALPQGTTASPFTIGRKRKLDSQHESFNSFRFSNGGPQDRGDSHRDRHKRRKPPPPTPQQCYFCLSNPACETHMIGSLGTDVYLATAKGPLTTAQTFPSLGFPCNILIIPLTHAPTIAAFGDDQSRRATATEMEKYHSALHAMVVAKSKKDDGQSDLGSVTWEISRGGGVHLHWQFLPVPRDLIDRNLVQAGFEVEAENLSYPKFVKGEDEFAEFMKGDYFRVMMWSGDTRKDIVLPLDSSFRFDLQFGRRVLGKLLDLQDRTNWRDCGQTKVEEEADATAFRESFKPFDFSLEQEA